MSIIVHEKFDSRETTVGIENPSIELRYMIEGTESDTAARAALESVIPALYGGLVFQEYHIAHQGGGVWEANVRYEKYKKNTGDSSYQFDTGGGTQHITQSLATVGRYAPPGKTAPDYKGAIGVADGTNVEGVDVTMPVYNFAETHYIPAANVTGSYKANIFWLTGRVNQAPFRGFAAGEVLFLGASGSQRGVEDWEITFRFAASPNATNLSVGNITGINKKGWEYLWVRYAEVEDSYAKMLVKEPIAAYVEQVYPYGDFSLLGIGT